MNKNMVLVLSAGLLLIVAVAVVGIGFLIAGGGSEGQAIITSTSTTSSVSTTVSSTTVETTVSSIPTTTVPKASLSLNITPSAYNPDDSDTLRLYDGDTAVLSASDASGRDVDGVEVYVGGELKGTTDSAGKLVFGPVEGGDYTLTAKKTGFEDSDMDLSVWDSEYGLSIYVRRKLEDSERDMNIRKGRVNLRFYDLPSCSICRVMRPTVSDIVSPNRDCILYEVISLWKYNEELAGKFGQTTTPVMEIQGQSGFFQTSGFVPSSQLETMIQKASPSCDIN